MSNISAEHKEKLQQLIYNEDFETVIQGLELLDTLAEDENDIYDVFDLMENVPSTVDELEKGIFDCEFKIYIIVWILGKLAELKINWVCNLTTLDLSWNHLSHLSEEELDSLFNSISKIPNLIKLDVSENQLTLLPKSIGNLTNLNELNFHF